MKPEELIGRTHTFSDGDRLVVTQIKLRDENEFYVTFEAYSGPGVPRKQVMSLTDFNSYYGHLFA